MYRFAQLRNPSLQKGGTSRREKGGFYRLPTAGFGASSAGSLPGWEIAARYWILDAGYWMLDIGYSILDIGWDPANAAYGGTGGSAHDRLPNAAGLAMKIGSGFPRGGRPLLISGALL